MAKIIQAERSTKFVLLHRLVLIISGSELICKNTNMPEFQRDRVNRKIAIENLLSMD